MRAIVWEGSPCCGVPHSPNTLSTSVRPVMPPAAAAGAAVEPTAGAKCMPAVNCVGDGGGRAAGARPSSREPGSEMPASSWPSELLWTDPGAGLSVFIVLAKRLLARTCGRAGGGGGGRCQCAMRLVPARHKRETKKMRRSTSVDSKTSNNENTRNMNTRNGNNDDSEDNPRSHLHVALVVLVAARTARRRAGNHRRAERARKHRRGPVPQRVLGARQRRLRVKLRQKGRALQRQVHNRRHAGAGKKQPREQRRPRARPPPRRRRARLVRHGVGCQGRWYPPRAIARSSALSATLRDFIILFFKIIYY